MDVLLYHSAPSHVRLQFVEKKTSSQGLQPSLSEKTQVLCSINSSSCWSLGASSRKQYLVKNPYHQEASGSLNSVRSRQVASRVFNESYSGAAVGGEQSLEDISDSADSVPKVLIPGLPEESKGESSASTSSNYWEWKPKFNVHYEKAGSENVNSPPLLFLPGFGVGSFHYEKQLKDLGRDYRVWALDFLGQGKSLPVEDPAPLLKDTNLSGQNNETWGFGKTAEPWAEELVYSVDLWKDQVQYFIEQVIGEPVYVVGNSLGGYVATYFAASNPQLVKGVTLLNATPFWGFLPNPTRSPVLSRIFPQAGTFPLPANVTKLMDIVWQKMSDPETIAELLRQVYADHSTDVDKVFSQIVETTEHPAAAAAFASIMCAPTGQLSFDESLSRCRESNVPFCLMYGKEDPWVKPFWGQHVKRQFREAPYYEISPAGHCPHDEVPEVVNYLLRDWIKSLESKGSVTLPLLDDAEAIQYDLTKDVEFIREGSKKLVTVRFFGSQFSIWNQIQSQIKARFRNIGMRPQ
ncbi:pheophytinase, chloroplastic [Beta vulgaris subsp. vulgaris]|uniref:pheophytinase, chloroplastic n=1 Tax=Beta vulgaris subsp. vulgaris TaxID=3555 RepID=UPI0020369C89|nr:pheophytinase, chloroplastic [Beta vulgaris subsp. vulgaris]XP_048495330.1 pheophytinase, chloroplastic [Beta vulgaris subsp. vulgaris]